MQRGPLDRLRQGTALTLGAISVGVFAGSGASGLTVAAAILLAAWVALFPVAGVLGNLALRPIVDAFWNQKLVGLGAFQLNPQSVVGIAVPFAIFTVLLGKGLLLRRPRSTEMALLCYALVSLAGVALGSGKGRAISDFARIVLPLSFYWLGVNWPILVSSIRPLMFILAVYAVVPVFSALLQITHVIHPLEGAVGNPTDLLRVTGLYHHPLEIGMRCCLSIPFALAAANLISSPTERRSVYAWAAVLSVFSWITLVRSTLVASSTELCAWFWGKGKRALVVAFIAVALIASYSLSPLRRVLENAWRPVEQGNYYELGTGRALLFVAQVTAFQKATIVQKLLGRGLHSTPAVNMQFAPTAALDPGIVDPQSGNIGAHNQYLRTLTESGLLGTGSLLLAIGLAYRCCRRVERRNRSKTEREFAAAAGTATIGLLIFGMTAAPFDGPGISWPIWIALGCVAGLDRSRPMPGNHGSPLGSV